MTDDARRRYWEAVESGDTKTANALAPSAIESLMTQADEAEREGKHRLRKAFCDEAERIKQGVLAFYSRGPSSPMTINDISKLEPGRYVVDLHREKWVVIARPYRNPFLMEEDPAVWSVGVRRLRDDAVTRIDYRNQWSLDTDRRKGGDPE